MRATGSHVASIPLDALTFLHHTMEILQRAAFAVNATLDTLETGLFVSRLQAQEITWQIHLG